jgi:hypothetical protein
MVSHVEWSEGLPSLLRLVYFLLVYAEGGTYGMREGLYVAVVVRRTFLT